MLPTDLPGMPLSPAHTALSRVSLPFHSPILISINMPTLSSPPRLLALGLQRVSAGS